MAIDKQKQGRRNRKAGGQFEADVRNYLRSFSDWFRKVRRNRVELKANDVGDLGNIQHAPGPRAISASVAWILQCKKTQRIDLATAMAEAAVQARNAGVPYYAVVHKRRMKPVAQSYVTMPLETWAAIVSGEHRRRIEKEGG